MDKNERKRAYNRAYHRFRNSLDFTHMERFYEKWGGREKSTLTLNPAEEERQREYRKAHSLSKETGDPKPLNDFFKKYGGKKRKSYPRVEPGQLFRNIKVIKKVGQNKRKENLWLCRNLETGEEKKMTTKYLRAYGNRVIKKRKPKQKRGPRPKISHSQIVLQAIFANDDKITPHDINKIVDWKGSQSYLSALLSIIWKALGTDDGGAGIIERAYHDKTFLYWKIKDDITIEEAVKIVHAFMSEKNKEDRQNRLDKEEVEKRLHVLNNKLDVGKKATDATKIMKDLQLKREMKEAVDIIFEIAWDRLVKPLLDRIDE